MKETQIKHGSYSPYILKPRAHLSFSNERRGALLRLEFDDGLVGYADCHPWESCGDLSLEDQLSALKNKVKTPLLSSSIAFARLDAEARHQDVSLTSDQHILKNHWLATDEETMVIGISEGFNYFKIKDENLIDSALKQLPKESKLRLDLNSRYTKKQFEDFLEAYRLSLDRFDFFEDPFPYVEDEWANVQEKHNVALACDRLSEKAFGKPDAAKVVVIKPAVQKFINLSPGQRVVVTSYLDHPLGQATAAYTAMQGGVNDVCGLNSHRVYQSTPFSERLSSFGSLFKFPKGNGFGFDRLLEKCDWINI